MTEPLGLALFTYIMAPASFFLGFAVATAGFTCWNLTVPLLFNWLEFDLFDALFLSIMMDTISSLVLVCIYLRHGKIDKPFVFHFGGVAAVAGALSSRLSDEFLQSHKHVLRGSVGYVPIFFGFVFLSRAARERQRKRQPGAGGADPELGSPWTTASEFVDADDGDVCAASELGDVRSPTAERAAAGIQPPHVLDSPPGTPTARSKADPPHHGRAAPPAEGWEVRLARSASAALSGTAPTGKFVKSTRSKTAGAPRLSVRTGPPSPSGSYMRQFDDAVPGPPVSPISTTRAPSLRTAHSEKVQQQAEGAAFMARQQARSTWLGYRSAIVYGRKLSGRERKRRMLLTAVLLGTLGSVCGIVGSGGGVMYVSVIIVVWGVDDLPLATGTGVALMCFQCAALLANFVDKPQVVRPEMLRCLGVVLPCCVAGAMVASQALLYLSMVSVNLMVAGVSFALGATITFIGHN
ncbi:hypothetical protein T492DRAFT_1038864 [Pavlovales sp. CCMP2436]|nr:hypothetical protein T492DRAFT_1038864 [Pavlovales sp. CCMP2436]